MLKANVALIYDDDDLEDDTYFYYKAGNTYRFITQSQLNEIDDGASKTLKYSYVDEDAAIKVSDKLEDADVSWSDTGRMQSITVTDASGNETTYDLSVSTDVDNNAYEDAYEEYEFQKGQYDKKLADINAQICIIEAQDKKLELKLQDLDTQQQALSTEMESVKKVIENNIKSSFKAFSA